MTIPKEGPSLERLILCCISQIVLWVILTHEKHLNIRKKKYSKATHEISLNYRCKPSHTYECTATNTHLYTHTHTGLHTNTQTRLQTDSYTYIPNVSANVEENKQTNKRQT